MWRLLQNRRPVDQELLTAFNVHPTVLPTKNPSWFYSETQQMRLHKEAELRVLTRGSAEELSDGLKYNLTCFPASSLTQGFASEMDEVEAKTPSLVRLSHWLPIHHCLRRAAPPGPWQQNRALDRLHRCTDTRHRRRQTHLRSLRRCHQPLRSSFCLPAAHDSRLFFLV